MVEVSLDNSMFLSETANFSEESYNRARYYDPASGRFEREDPLRFLSGVNFYPYVQNSAPNLIDPKGLWGGGVIANVSAEAGLGLIGAAGTVNAGFGGFSGEDCGCPKDPNVGGFASAGGFVGGPNYGPTYPNSPNTSGKLFDIPLGLYGGGGAGFFLTNAKCVKQLKGPFNNFNVDFSLGLLPWTFSVGLALDPDSGTWSFSLTSGPGWGYGVVSLPTNTWTTKSYSLN
jgi:RHS repeat-associated protein